MSVIPSSVQLECAYAGIPQILPSFSALSKYRTRASYRTRNQTTERFERDLPPTATMQVNSAVARLNLCCVGIRQRTPSQQLHTFGLFINRGKQAYNSSYCHPQDHSC